MDMIKCKSCGAEMPGDIDFCGICGASMKSAETVPAASVANAATEAPKVEKPPKPAKPAKSSKPAKQPKPEKAPKAVAEKPTKPAEPLAAAEKAPKPPKPEKAPKPAAEKQSFDFKKKIVEPITGAVKNFDVKKHLAPTIAVAAACALLVCVVCVAAVVALTSGSQYTARKGSAQVFTDYNGDDRVIVLPDGGGRVIIEGTLAGSSISLNGKKLAVLIDDTGEAGSVGYALYMVTDKIRLVADDAYGFLLAPSGDALAFIREYDPDEGMAELWLYSGGDSKRVSSDYYCGGNRLSYYSVYNQMYYCALSPDGKTVAYVNKSGDRFTGIVWNGKETELGRDAYPAAVSNGAKYIYFTRNDAMYVQRGFDDSKREKLGDGVTALITNKDLSQAVYNTSDRAYISIKGGQRETLSGTVNGFILPQATASFYSLSGVTVYGLDSFANTFYKSKDDALMRINKKFETDSVVRNVDNVFLAGDGKTLNYLRSSSIYRVNGRSTRAEPVRIVAGDVAYFTATDDGKAVFYRDVIDELYYQKGESKPVMVSNDLKKDGSYSLFKGKTLYYINGDDELCASSGGRGARIGGINGEVKWVGGSQFHVYARTDDYGDSLLYRSANGKKFNLILQPS
jgi:hypothetical protein